MNETQKEIISTQQISLVVKKSSITNSYIATQPMTYDMYLLYLLCTETLISPASIAPIHDFDQSVRNYEKNVGINFYKTSAMKCLTTSQLFIHKNHGYIELFSVYDLTNTEDLCLPKSPKFVMTAKNFMNFMIQKSDIYKQQPEQFFIVIDEQGHAHLTTDLQSLIKKSLWGLLQKKLTQFFIKK